MGCPPPEAEAEEAPFPQPLEAEEEGVPPLPWERQVVEQQQVPPGQEQQQQQEPRKVRQHLKLAGQVRVRRNPQMGLPRRRRRPKPAAAAAVAAPPLVARPSCSSGSGAEAAWVGQRRCTVAAGPPPGAGPSLLLRLLRLRPRRDLPLEQPGPSPSPGPPCHVPFQVPCRGPSLAPSQEPSLVPCLEQVQLQPRRDCRPEQPLGHQTGRDSPFSLCYVSLSFEL